MMGALLEIDRASIERYAHEQNLAPEEALPRLLDEAVAAAEQAGRAAAEETGQKLIYTRASVDRERTATLSAGAGFSGDRERECRLRPLERGAR